MAFLLDEARSIRWDLEASEITLGRATENHVVLDHPSVSRRHARILGTGGGYLLEDLGSSTGTSVNGVPVRQHWLVPGDLVTLGPVPLRFLAEPAPAAAPPAPPPAARPQPAPRPRMPAAVKVLLGGAGVLAAAAWIALGLLYLGRLPRAGPDGEARTGAAEAAPPLIPADLGVPALPPVVAALGDELARAHLSAERGGEVAAGPLRIVVPGGALDTDRELSIRAATVAAPELDLAPLVGGGRTPVRVLASWDVGLGDGAPPLARPAAIEVDLGSLGSPPIAFAVASFDGRTWARLPSRVEDGRLLFATRHFCPVAAVGTEATAAATSLVTLTGVLQGLAVGLPVFAAGYLIYDRGREFPSVCQAHAPYVAMRLGGDPEGFEISWSTKLPNVDPDTGIADHDPDVLLHDLEKLVLEHQHRAGSPSTDPLDWPREVARELNDAVNRLLVETTTPPEVLEVRRALVFAREYLAGRGFAPPALDLPVYVTPTLGGDAGFLHNPWSGRRYVFVATDISPGTLWTTVLHEQFHHVQTSYVWVDRTSHLPLMEASALLLEREAAAHYRAAGKPFDASQGLALAQLTALHNGLDGPHAWEEGPVRRLGYSLTWFLEFLRDRRSSAPAQRAAFHAQLLESWRGAATSGLRQALAWGAGGDEAALRSAWRSFARDEVLVDLEHHAGARGPIGARHGCAPFTDSPYRPAVADTGATLRDAYGFEPTILDFAARPVHAIGEPALRPWSIQFHRATPPPGRPAGTLVVRIPRELQPAEGAAVDVLVRSASTEPAAVPIASFDRTPAESDAHWAALPFDGERFLYLVETGLAGGWLSSIPQVTVILLEPPTQVAMKDDGGVITVSWTPPAVAAEPGVLTGYRVRVTDTANPWTMVLDAGQTSTRLDYRAQGGRNVLGVEVSAVIQTGRDGAGEPTFLESAPSSASSFRLEGPQWWTLHVSTVPDSVECRGTERQPLPMGLGFDEEPVTIGADGSLALDVERPWDASGRAVIEARAQVIGDRIRIAGSSSATRSSDSFDVESFTSTCTFDGETRLRYYSQEASVGIEPGLRGSCTATFDSSGRYGGSVHQTCTAEIELSGSFRPRRQDG